MKVEIHIRDTKKNGTRIGMKNAFVESVRVYKEAGDGLRLDNLAEHARQYFVCKSVELVNEWREGVKRSGSMLKTSGESPDCDTCSANCTKESQPQQAEL